MVWLLYSILLLPFSVSIAEEVSQVNIEDIVNINPTAEEQSHLDLLKKSVVDDNSSALNGREVKYLSLSTAIMQALKKNFAITRSRLTSQDRQEAMLEAEAVFDPVFNVSIGHSEEDAHKREKWGTVYQKKFTARSEDYRKFACLEVAVNPPGQPKKDPADWQDLCKGEDGDPNVFFTQYRALN